MFKKDNQKTNPQTGEYSYFAFISYKREDEKWAIWLKKKLQSYKLPAELRRKNKELPLHCSPIFLDKTDALPGYLKEELRKQVQSSKFLIVICSEISHDQSEYLDFEIQSFLERQNSSPKRIIPFIVGDSSQPEKDCFPPSLQKLCKTEMINGTNIHDSGKNDAFLKMVACMHGLKMIELKKLEKIKKIKRIVLSIFAALMLLVMTFAFIKYYTDNNHSKEAYLINMAKGSSDQQDWLEAAAYYEAAVELNPNAEEQRVALAAILQRNRWPIITEMIPNDDEFLFSYMDLIDKLYGDSVLIFGSSPDGKRCVIQDGMKMYIVDDQGNILKELDDGAKPTWDFSIIQNGYANSWAVNENGYWNFYTSDGLIFYNPETNHELKVTIPQQALRLDTLLASCGTHHYLYWSGTQFYWITMAEDYSQIKAERKDWDTLFNDRIAAIKAEHKDSEFYVGVKMAVSTDFSTAYFCVISNDYSAIIRIDTQSLAGELIAELELGDVSWIKTNDDGSFLAVKTGLYDDKQDCLRVFESDGTITQTIKAVSDDGIKDCIFHGKTCDDLVVCESKLLTFWNLGSKTQSAMPLKTPYIISSVQYNSAKQKIELEIDKKFVYIDFYEFNGFSKYLQEEELQLYLNTIFPDPYTIKVGDKTYLKVPTEEQIGSASFQLTDENERILDELFVEGQDGWWIDNNDGFLYISYQLDQGNHEGILRYKIDTANKKLKNNGNLSDALVNGSFISTTGNGLLIYTFLGHLQFYPSSDRFHNEIDYANKSAFSWFLSDSQGHVLIDSEVKEGSMMEIWDVKNNKQLLHYLFTGAEAESTFYFLPDDVLVMQLNEEVKSYKLFLPAPNAEAINALRNIIGYHYNSNGDIYWDWDVFANTMGNWSDIQMNAAE